MATNNESESDKNNDVPASGESGHEGLSAEQAAESSYNESEAWQKSKNSLLILLGLIAIGVAAYTYFDNSQRNDKSERSYRFLSASINSDGAEKRFLSFADDYDDTLAGVARYRAAVLQYREKRYDESAKNFRIAHDQMGSDPLSGRALLGQAVSLLKSDLMKGGEGKAVLEKLSLSESYLPTDRNEARYLLALQSLAENDMDSVNAHKEKLADDINASYFLNRLEDLIKTNNFLALAKSLADVNLVKGQTFLKKNGERTGVFKLESGLQYEVLSRGSGSSPKAEDSVEVHYLGTLINGEVFESSIEREPPASFSVNQVIKGWTEALQLMKEGAKWKLYIPADMAYGESGSNAVGPNETLIFEVELLKVIPRPVEPSPDVNATVPAPPPAPIDANISSSISSISSFESDLNASSFFSSEEANQSE